MSVLHPALLAVGLAAVAIPVLIHLLFRRRRKPIVWAAMRFLLEAYRRQRRRLTLEQLLLLLVRCALVAVVALALAQPLVRSGAALAGAGGGRDVYILIDNSLTSQLRSQEGGSAFARHQEAAKAAVAALGAADRAAVIALGSPAQGLVLPPSSDSAGVAAAIEALEPVDAAADLRGALALVAEDLAQRSDRGGRPATVLLLSELRRGTFDARSELEPVFADADQAPAALALAPAQDSPGQVQVASIEPARQVLLAGEAAEPVRITLRRFGDAVQEEGATGLTLRALRVSRSGAAREAGATRATVRWRRGQSSRVVALQPPVSQEGADAFTVLEASIDRDALPSDDVRRAALTTQRRLRVAVLGRPGARGTALANLPPERWLSLALAPTERTPVETLEVDPASLDAPALAGAAAAALVRPDLVDEKGWTLLRRYVDDGGLLIVFPPAQESLHLWTDAFVEALDLPWRFDREAVDFGDEGRRLAAEQPASATLSHLAPELEVLAPPVTVVKALLPRLAGPQARHQPLLALETGEVWAAQAQPASRAEDQQPSRGAVVFVASALSVEWTDLPARPLWLPLAQELVRQGAALSGAARRLVAGGRAAFSSGVVEAAPIALAGERPGRPVAVGPDGLTLQPIRTAGLLRTVNERGATVGIAAVNPAADAGDVQAQSQEEAQRALAALVGGGEVRFLEGEPAQSVAASLRAAGAQAGRSIAAALLLAALGLALLETLLARLFSHAGPLEGAGP